MSRGGRGAALVVVLALALVLAAMVGLGALYAALEARAAHNAELRAVAEGAAEGALQAAAEEVLRSWRDGRAVGAAEVGPWPDAGLEGSARITPLEPGRVRVVAEARYGGTAVERSVELRREAAGASVLSRP